MTGLNVPGTSFQAYATLPLRVLLAGMLFSMSYPLVLLLALLRAIYLRAWHGAPSAILKKGTFNNVHKSASNHVYPSHIILAAPVDQAKMRPILETLAAEGGVEWDQVELRVMVEAPADWPESGSWRSDYFVPQLKGIDHFTYWQNRSGCVGKVIRVHIWNAKEEGKPTVVLYGGSGYAWDGSSNFNFFKELMTRYAGLPHTNVFKTPDIDPAIAAKLDNGGSFVHFLCKMPVNLAKNVGGIVWNVMKSVKWAGGNGIGFKLCAMNFSADESRALYEGAKTMGLKPFACFNYAAVKACKEVLGEAPSTICQQASLQSRYYPVQGQGKSRDYVGDWLFGPVQHVDNSKVEYTPADAQAAYGRLLAELDTVGPALRSAFWAKAYGIQNSGSAGFEIMPWYNDDCHVMDRCLFLNNYGVRTVPEEANFHTWNWNAPLWLGLNTINVNGRTSTMIGSFFHGRDLVHAVRDNVESTLRGIMAKAPS